MNYKFIQIAILFCFAICLFVSCADDDGSSNASGNASGDDDDDDDDNDDNDNDDNNDDNDDDDNDDDDDDDVPYWEPGDDFGSVDLDEYRLMGDQGYNAWEQNSVMAARDALLLCPSVWWVATLDNETGHYVLWHPHGDITFSRAIGESGLEIQIVAQNGPTPFPNQDPMSGAGYEQELTQLQNPDEIQMTDHEYEPDDPRVGWVPDDSSCAPNALLRIAQVFDTPHGPDLVFDFYPTHGGGTGSHGSLGLYQSRAVFMLSGAGVNPLGVIEDSANLVDLAPTALALLGANTVEGIDHRGHRVSNNFLTWQDGRVRTEVLQNSAVQGLANQVVVLLFDGLTPNELMFHMQQGDQTDLPNLYSLFESGTFFSGGAVVGWPSFSLPGHTTMGTGTWQGHHGLLSNDNYNQETGDEFSFNWFINHVDEIAHDPQVAVDYYLNFYHEQRGVETIFDAVHRTFGDWDLEQPGTWLDAYTSCVNELTFLGADYGYYPLLQVLSALLPQPDKFDPDVYALADMTVPVQFMLTLLDPTHPVPKLTLASFYLTDHDGEAHGPHSEALRRDLVTLDGYVGVIINLLKQRDLFDDTAFIVTSDHGMELLKPGSYTDWRALLAAAGIKYRTLSGKQLLYLKVLRLTPDTTTLPGGENANLTVIATDDDNAMPVPDAVLTLTGGDCAPCTAVTNDQGEATFSVTPTAGQNLILQSTHENYCDSSTTVIVP